jgi:hypothetical protein
MNEANFFEVIVRQLEPELDVTGLTVNKQILLDKINRLIVSNFSKLISILRRMDVSERKLKKLLDEKKNTDAAQIILDLMIERQIEKIKTKENFKTDSDIPEDEKW